MEWGDKIMKPGMLLKVRQQIEIDISPSLEKLKQYYYKPRGLTGEEYDKYISQIFVRVGDVFLFIEEVPDKSDFPWVFCYSIKDKTYTAFDYDELEEVEL